MQLNIFTLFAVLYAATQINAQTTSLCKCITNGVEDHGATTACCSIGTVIVSACAVLRGNVDAYLACCTTENQGAECINT
ncbi:hypothetical protein FB451DRAFT_1285797 [Mycena latifolia]|nr:hypothetical protein FB451DRAFT_1285797 [Mycena latifolia]